MTNEILGFLSVDEFELHSPPLGIGCVVRLLGVVGEEVGVVIISGSGESLGWLGEEEEIGDGEEYGDDQLKKDSCLGREERAEASVYQSSTNTSCS